MIEFIGLFASLVMCHLIGDYVLQNDFIAQTKGENEYHMFVHVTLYCLPFCFVLNSFVGGFILVTSHYIIDTLKAKCNKITYNQDQAFHYIVLLLISMLNVIILN